MPDETTETDHADEHSVSEIRNDESVIIDDPEVATESEPEDDDADTFPRSYVERLRRESAGYRERAQRGDTYAQRLHTELVRATGRLADPTDLAFDETHLDDPDALVAAVDDLLTRKPHLATRRPSGDIGQGAMSGAAANVDLAALLRQRAG
ncbi:hypothetical protein NIIDNTM18_49720 [Mycolicibacterium litorale]|uniref:Uncharacterized protein n=1 Tax=Mycolicibacterium litorale TaxID=758802 RepID=A0A6S6PAF4_9MYCO|nr:hypothetical protein [Mycolicibacterium litorale]BCI55694.1 hypothetical protein NIIDNTM18_49720 [Mycolicibacterium litorale]